jgi:hypothetical protein
MSIWQTEEDNNMDLRDIDCGDQKWMELARLCPKINFGISSYNLLFLLPA